MALIRINRDYLYFNNPTSSNLYAQKVMNSGHFSVAGDEEGFHGLLEAHLQKNEGDVQKQEIDMLKNFNTVSYEENHQALIALYKDRKKVSIVDTWWNALNAGRMGFTPLAATIKLTGYKAIPTLVNVLYTYNETDSKVHCEQGQIVALFCPPGNVRIFNPGDPGVPPPPLCEDEAAIIAVLDSDQLKPE
jgi:phage antirepressor YoqD-like protein